MTPSVDARRMAFREWFGLSPLEAEMLSVLYSAGAAVFTPRALLASRLKTTPGTVPVHMTFVREALETEAIDNEPGRGYRLTDAGMAECRAALWSLGEELRSAA